MNAQFTNDVSYPIRPAVL